MNVVFRVDASVEIGSGHVMRCLTLAHQLKEKGIHSTFISRDLTGNMNAYIAKQFPVVELPTIADEDAWQWTAQHWQQDAKETIASLKDKAKLVIVDHYSLDEKWQQILRPYTEKIMVIDDLANRKHDCDILLDQNYYENMDERYLNLVPQHTKLLLGPKNALLRKEFEQAKKIITLFEGQIKRIFVFFGGSDFTNETEKVILAIRPLAEKNNLTVDVVVGSSNRNKELIKAMCSETSVFNYHYQIDNIAKLMAKADLAIGAGGATTWERITMRLPALVIIIADNQKQLSLDVEKLGVIKVIGESSSISVKQIYNSVLEIINNPRIIVEMIKRCSELMR